MKKIIVLITSMLIYSCGGNQEKENHTADDSIPVNVIELSDKTEVEKLTLSGEVKSGQSAEISTRVSGYIEQLPVRIGQKIEKGQLLVGLQSAELNSKKAAAKAGVENAVAAFKNSEFNYNRINNLYNLNSASKSELDQATMQYEMAASALEAAKQMLAEVQAQVAYNQIRAPFSGIITQKNVDMGDMALPGKTLLVLENPKIQEIIVRVSESDINSLTTNMDLQVYIDAIGLHSGGKLVEISPSGTFSGGQYWAKVKLDTVLTAVLPGMFARVDVGVKNEKESTILVPKSALVHRGGLTGVYTLSLSNTAVLRWIQKGAEQGEEVIVVSGLAKGEKIIVNPESRLFNGAHVSIK